MAKDDYDYLVFKILTYLYACFRRRGHFETSTLCYFLVGAGGLRKPRC